MIRAATSLILLLLTAPFGTETVDVRDSGHVDLGTFECRDINRSSIVQRVCYDRAQHTLIVGVNGSYERYCELPTATFDGFMTAPSMGQFFNRNIRGSGADGRFRCPAQNLQSTLQLSSARPAETSQSVSIAPTLASATTVPSTLASP